MVSRVSSLPTPEHESSHVPPSNPSPIMKSLFESERQADLLFEGRELLRILLVEDFPENQVFWSVRAADTLLVEFGHIALKNVFELFGRGMFRNDFGGVGVQDAENLSCNLSLVGVFCVNQG